MGPVNASFFERISEALFCRLATLMAVGSVAVMAASHCSWQPRANATVRL